MNIYLQNLNTAELDIILKKSGFVSPDPRDRLEIVVFKQVRNSVYEYKCVFFDDNLGTYNTTSVHVNSDTYMGTFASCPDHQTGFDTRNAAVKSLLYTEVPS